MTQQPASWAVLNTTSIINRLMQWKQKLIKCHSQSEISTNSWKCLACNRFVECLTGSFPFWSLSKFCHSWSCKEAMQRCCFADLDQRTPHRCRSARLQGFKARTDVVVCGVAFCFCFAKSPWTKSYESTTRYQITSWISVLPWNRGEKRNKRSDLFNF